MRRMIVCACLAMLTSVAIAERHTGTLKRVADTREFRIGFQVNSPPFSFIDDSGLPVGYSIDLCRRIAAAVKEAVGRDDIEVEFVPVELRDRIDAIKSNKVDIVCGSDTITLARMESVDFTLMTFVTGGALLSKPQAAIATTGDLAGRRVGVVRGTTTEKALKNYLETNLIDAEVVTAENDNAALSRLDKGEIDAFASDQIVLIGQIIQSADPQAYRLSEDLFSYEPYGLMVRRNDADFRLVANRALSSLYRSGQYRSMYDRWFGRVGVRPSPILAAMYKLQSLPE